MFENPIEKNDEHWRDNLVGLTLNKRVEKAIMQRHSLQSQLERLELQRSRIKQQIAGKKVELLPNIFEGVMCAATDKKRKILDIGFNTPEDLILDNFGLWLAGLIKNPVGGASGTTCKDTANASKTILCFGQQAGSAYNFNLSAIATGSLLQLGNGTTAAARSNYCIQTAFGAAPENAAFGTGAGSYAAGYVNFAASITAGGSGTVNETGFFGRWCDYGQSLVTIMLFHDILGSGVAFVAGNSLIVSYSIAI